jgi:hypothetical protein
VSQHTFLAIIKAETANEETKRLLLHGMQNLVSALAEVMGIEFDGEGEARQ